MLMALVSLYLCLFRFPLIPIWMGFDQVGVFVLDASRFWAGDRFYLDFFDMTTPGIKLVHVLFFELFGQRNWIPNADLLLSGVLLTSLIAFISRKVLREGALLSLLPAVLFLAFYFIPVMVDSHRWYSSAASYAALAVVLERRSTKRLTIAGILCGMATFFTQTQGFFTAAGLVVFLLWEGDGDKLRWRQRVLKAIIVLASFLTTVLVTESYFVWKAGWSVFFDCLVRFPAIYAHLARADDSFSVYLSEIPRSGSMIHLLFDQSRYLLLYALVPFIYFIALIMNKRYGRNQQAITLTILLSIMGLSFLGGVAPSPSYFRLCSVCGPALILLVYFLQGHHPIQRIAVACLSTAALFSIVHHTIQIQTAPINVLQLQRGPFAFSKASIDDYQFLAWLSAHTHPGEIFFSAGDAGIYYPLALRPMDKTTDYDNTGFTRSQDVQNAIDTLERYRVRLIEWPPGVCAPEFYRSNEDHLAPLRSYVQLHYHPLKAFAGTEGAYRMEIWQRNE